MGVNERRRPSRTEEATQERLEKILMLRHIRQLPWRDVAAEVGMSESACKQAYAAWLNGDREAVIAEDQVETTQRILWSQRHHRQILADAVETAKQPAECKECGKPCGHVARPGVMVSAARALEDIAKDEVVIRQLTGLMPRDLGDVGEVIGGRQIALGVLEVFDAHIEPGSKLSERIKDALVAKFDTPSVRALPA